MALIVYSGCIGDAGLARSPSEVIEELEGIVHECPEFYPAVLELPLCRMASEADNV